jgi:signal transduction histidine kinase
LFAISVYIRQSSGEGTFHEGILHPLPLELRDQPRMRQYAKVDRAGWGKLEFGYWYYAHSTENGDLLVFPGLILNDEATPTKRFPGHSQKWTRQQVKSFATRIADFLNQTAAGAQEDMNLLVHDLRALSNTIYNSGLEALTYVEAGNFAEAKKRIDNVIASQGMLRLRTDALDFVGNPTSVIQFYDFNPFKKIDKVVRCFKSSAHAQNKRITLSGESHGKIFGPEVFEIVPYLLLDNAIKYSPEHFPIDVMVWEQPNFGFSVTSFGPHIAFNERETIFSKGLRGQAAIAAGVPGSGVGLHIAKKLIEEHFSGTIEVHQDPSVKSVNGDDFYSTSFIVRVALPLKK